MIFAFIAALTKLQAEADMATHYELEAKLNSIKSELDRRINSLDFDIRQTAHELLLHKKEPHSEVRHPCTHKWSYHDMFTPWQAEFVCTKCGMITLVAVEV